jgi:hypothetical protein
MVIIVDKDIRNPNFRRNLFICKFYDHTGGSQELSNDFVELAGRLGFNDTEIRDYTMYFEGKGYIKVVGGYIKVVGGYVKAVVNGEDSMMPDSLSLTTYGSDYVESINCKKAEEVDKELHNVSLDIG